MQHPAVPELAHTTTRPIHWIVTAAAVSGLIALSSALQPGSATAAQPPTEAKTAPATTTPPDPARADIPLDCGPVKVIVEKKATGDLDGDGRPETVAVAHCDAGMGTPPDGVYVLTQAADSSKPRVVATLVDPKDRLTITDFAVRDAAVTATLLGYSSSDVPSCCPDTKTPAKWQWKGGAFIRSTPSGTQAV
ncbi:hypothetical protein [Streptomyces colonosanans]|uniref:Secreted protein n=1 Tax=Streptomyces colonosanans TaxID=1428652 RepID=A0A1S2PF92_9ACTN|nr:hypothetical protein [Streptomyces colonosanans]OIJ92451.1 hypothetical protein BIV24_13550 [Streptomyces colonosanans]